MKLTRREFLAVGASLALSACGGSGDSDTEPSEQEEEAEPEPEAPEQAQIVEDTTYYDVFRVDWKEGLFGDVEAYTSNTTDFSDSYAILQPDGLFSFEINGVPYNGSISLGNKTTHLYSGTDAEVTQLLFDGNDDTTVGSVLVQGYYVNDDKNLLIELTTDVDGKQVFATYYLWEHKDTE